MSHQEITFGDFSDEEGYASTISLYYSEEEPYYHYDDDSYVDSCDEDRSRDECDINEQRVPDSEMDNYYGPELPDDVYEDIDPEEIDILQENDYDDFYPKKATFKVSKPSKVIWMKTWPKEDNKVWVSVYGWHNEIKGYGGYAVIVRNMSAKPIIASARFSRSSVSFLHQVLKGLKSGLDLASEHGCSSPRVLCNSRLVTQLLNKSCSCEIKMVSTTICKICMSNIFTHLDEVYISKLVPLIETLQAQRRSSTFEWDSMNHEAVHYLAKMVKKTAKNYGRRFYKIVMKEPEEFPNELVDILWHEAYYGTAYFNLDERVEESITNAVKGFVTNSANGLIGDVATPQVLTCPAGIIGEDEDVTIGHGDDGNVLTTGAVSGANITAVEVGLAKGAVEAAATSLSSTVTTVENSALGCGEKSRSVKGVKVGTPQPKKNNIGSSITSIISAETWTPAPKDFMKINIDGAYKNNLAAAAAYITSDRGTHQASETIVFHSDFYPEALARAALLGIQLAIHLNFKYVILESDSPIIISSLLSKGKSIRPGSFPWRMISMINETVDAAKVFKGLQFKMIKGGANRFAHNLAEFALANRCTSRWIYPSNPPISM